MKSAPIVSYMDFLDRRADAFPPRHTAFFVELSTASYYIVDILLGPSRGRKRLIKLDPKLVTQQQYSDIYNLIFWTLVSIFMHINPALRDSTFAACEEFIGIKSNEREMVGFVSNMSKPDVGPVCARLYAGICKILRYEGGPLDWFLLAPHFTVAFTGAVESYRDDLDQLK